MHLELTESVALLWLLPEKDPSLPTRVFFSSFFCCCNLSQPTEHMPCIKPDLQQTINPVLSHLPSTMNDLIVPTIW
ncbi:Uncharacterised protein (plasmid) [Escherichia coli]|nr:Uncharacterised protein [Escherichia coli]